MRQCAGACFTCGATDHQKKNCPVWLARQAAGGGKDGGQHALTDDSDSHWVFSLTMEEAEAASAEAKARRKAKKAAEKAAKEAANKSVSIEIELDMPPCPPCPEEDEDVAGPAEEQVQERKPATEAQLKEEREKMRAQLQAEMKAR